RIAQCLQATSDGVAHHSIPDLLRNNEPESRVSAIRVPADVGHGTPTSAATTTTHDVLVVSSARNAKSLGEHCRPDAELRGELGATLATAGLNDRAAGAGAHTSAETVNLCTTTVVGLERSLAHC